MSLGPTPNASSADAGRPNEAPYESFHHSFREVVAAHWCKETKSFLHVVFGSIADIREMPVVIPVGQAFDFLQRGPRSVLASFEGIRVGRRPFFDYVEKAWPPAQRPKAAGLGHVKYISLPKNTNGLPGVLFVVTTRDLSSDPQHYGFFVNTPIEGIDYILDGVIDTAGRQTLPTIALPLLGTGYANIRRSINQNEFGRLLKQTVALLTIQKLQRALRNQTSSLRRAVVVIYSGEAQGRDEHALWEAITRFLGSTAKEGDNQLRALLQQVSEGAGLGE